MNDKIVKYRKSFFTDEGVLVLHNYLKDLVKLYYDKKDEDYPFVIGVVLGIPFFNNTVADRSFKNKSELKGRIKGFMQLLNIKTVEINKNNYKIIFDIRGDD